MILCYAAVDVSCNWLLRFVKRIVADHASDRLACQQEACIGVLAREREPPTFRCLLSAVEAVYWREEQVSKGLFSVSTLLLRNMLD